MALPFFACRFPRSGRLRIVSAGAIVLAIVPTRKSQGPWWPRFFADAIQPRLEIIATILMDSGVIVVALLVRGVILKAYRYGVEGATVPWHLRALEIVLDYGIVATAIVLVVFDLSKRIRNGVKDYFGADSKQQ